MTSCGLLDCLNLDCLILQHKDRWYDTKVYEVHMSMPH